MNSPLLTYPALADCRRLFLRHFEIMMNIGVYESEKKGPQRVLINVDVYVPLTDNTPKEDKLLEVVDYNLMRDTIHSIAAVGHIHLLETLCDKIADTLMQHKLIRAVGISAEKPDVYPDSEGVGVEILRIKT